MKFNWSYNLLFALLFYCIFSGQVIYAQQGDISGGSSVFDLKKDKKKSKPVSKTKKINATKSKDGSSGDVNSTNSKQTRRYSFRIMYKNDSEIEKTANRVRMILLKQGYKSSGFEIPPQDDLYYDNARKPDNAYLSFDSSVPPEVIAEVSKIIKRVLPSVQIETNVDFALNNYFLLWIV